MKIIKPDNLALLFTPCVPGDHCCIAVAAMACFSLDQSSAERLRTESELWQAVAEELGEEEPLDLGYPKQRGEFLVYGSCHAQSPIRGSQVGVAVAGLQKTLQVSGPRFWNAAGIPSEPELFRELRISWTNAFGGTGYDLNPSGQGAIPSTDNRVPLPPVQDPSHPILSPNDRPEPAGFNALNPFWPQRASHLGRFDDTWLKQRWPHYPHDTNPEYFNTAPADQRLNGFFKGDEPVRIVNMHPLNPELHAALPGLRARLFVNRVIDGLESFREIETRAETLWLFPSAECGILLFRGVTQVADETFDDLTHLMAEWELMSDQPCPLEYYHAKFLEAIAPEADTVAEPPPPPEPPQTPAEAVPKPPPAAPPKPPLPPDADKEMAKLQAVLADAEAQADAVFARLGITRAEALEKYLPKPKAAPAQSEAELKNMLAELQQQAEAILKKQGSSLDEVKKAYCSPKTVPEDPQVMIQQLTDALLSAESQLKKSGVNLQEMAQQLPGIDPSKLDFGKAVAGLSSLAAALPLKSAAAAPASPENEIPPAPADEVQPTGVGPEEALEQRIQQGKDFAGLNLDGRDFRGRDLSNADFSGSVLTGANFSGAVLTGASFAGALLADADFSHARMEQTKLVQVQAVGARFVAAACSGADLSASDFSGCLFDGADLSKANLSGSLFAGASLRAVRGTGLTAVQSTFPKADLSGANLLRANLTTADFSNAQLNEACFSETTAVQATFDGVTGKGTDFSRAQMLASRADKDTNLVDAVFSNTDLSRSCWERARLNGAQMAGTVLDHADFSRVEFSRVVMVNATARETNFMKAAMTGCDLRGVNFFKASFRHARLSGSDLKEASMFGTDLYGAKITASDTAGTNFSRAQARSAA